MKIGEVQTLTIVKAVNFGVYLTDRPDCGEGARSAGKKVSYQSGGKGTADEPRVLLPAKQVPAGSRVGDKLEVFLYRDSDDRLIATTRKPLLTVGALAALRVAQVTKLGAFLDWGLEKDLFLPYKEQLCRLSEQDKILVTMYVDKSGRLCASMRGLYSLLGTGSPYRAGDIVSGRVYEFSRNFGTFVAVDDRYSAMIPIHEDTSSLRIGDVIRATVSNVKEDGKLDLTLRKKAYEEIDTDAESVMDLIEHYGGELPFNDKADPEVIRHEAHMSKSAFKRAVGHLYKERRVEFTGDGIRKIK